MHLRTCSNASVFAWKVFFIFISHKYIHIYFLYIRVHIGICVLLVTCTLAGFNPLDLTPTR
jgi:hypothetical protein